MPKKPEIVELDLQENLFDSRRQATSMSLPQAVHYRLDILAELAKKTGASRAEIVGVLIADADLVPVEIEKQVMEYRNKLVGDVVPHEPVPEPGEAGEKHGNVFAFEKRGPGRPGRKAG